ncbi:MAG TPA: amidohydrolase family protein, partial [Verrucomicrobiae bacterium]|nr:amidohydrolase family protein [Verrucomicrobiae bacterium]
AVGLDGCIAVQARQSLEENRFLLGLADRYPFIKGVVGWVDLRADDVARHLEEFAAHPKFVGVRHVAQDEPDDRFLVGKEFLRGISKLKQFDLAYDILIFPKQLPAAIELANRFPDQRFVLDHIAKPNIREQVMEPWRTHIRELAKAKNVVCKISGMVTEANWDAWKEADFRPYLDVVTEAFGFERLMYGSDWPVCLLAGEYKDVHSIAGNWIKHDKGAKPEALFGGAGAAFYQVT